MFIPMLTLEAAVHFNYTKEVNKTFDFLYVSDRGEGDGGFVTWNEIRKERQQNCENQFMQKVTHKQLHT